MNKGSARDGTQDKEKDQISAIQEAILRTLLTAREADVKFLEDHYRAFLLKRIRARSVLWSFRMLAIPVDSDFVYCCYRTLLEREPDSHGYAGFLNGLYTSAVTRLDILHSMLDSAELQRSGRLVRGRRALWLALKALPLFRATGLHALIRLAWRIATLSEHSTRMQFLVAQLDEKASHADMRSIDLIEYLHNNAK